MFFFYNKENKYVFLKDIVSEWVKFVMEEDIGKKDIIMEVFLIRVLFLCLKVLNV